MPEERDKWIQVCLSHHSYDCGTLICASTGLHVAHGGSKSICPCSRVLGRTFVEKKRLSRSTNITAVSILLSKPYSNAFSSSINHARSNIALRLFYYVIHVPACVCRIPSYQVCATSARSVHKPQLSPAACSIQLTSSATLRTPASLLPNLRSGLSF